MGVPTNYFYEKVADIERGTIQIRQKEINWNSTDGQQLQEALVLTEKEQIFAIARSILQLNTYKLLITSLYGPITCGLSYGIGQFINIRYNLYARPLPVSIYIRKKMMKKLKLFILFNFTASINYVYTCGSIWLGYLFIFN